MLFNYFLENKLLVNYTQFSLIVINIQDTEERPFTSTPLSAVPNNWITAKSETQQETDLKWKKVNGTGKIYLEDVLYM